MWHNILQFIHTHTHTQNANYIHYKDDFFQYFIYVSKWIHLQIIYL